MIVGCDEVGRGCFAGPVCSACCILPDTFPDDKYKQIKDSKKLSKKKREELEIYIKENAIAFSYGIVDNNDIDKINILQATQKSFHIALNDLWKKQKFSKILVDGNYFVPWFSPGIDGEVVPYDCIVKGDDKELVISCASILAKTYRDRLMIEYDDIYPEYDIKNNKGYGTKKHIDAIKIYGLTNIHRKTFINFLNFSI